MRAKDSGSIGRLPCRLKGLRQGLAQKTRANALAIIRGKGGASCKTTTTGSSFELVAGFKLQAPNLLKSRGYENRDNNTA